MALDVFMRHARFTDTCCKLLALDSSGSMYIEWYRIGKARIESLNEFQEIKIDNALWVWSPTPLDSNSWMLA